MANGIASFFWTIYDAGKFTGVPTELRTRNTLDAHGSFLDLKRLDSEEDVAYWKRLSSVIPLRAGSDTIGLIHGITRELGLEEKIGLKISPVSDGTKWLSISPFAEITATQLILYSTYRGKDDSDNVVDTIVDIYDHGDGYLLEDIILQVQQSEYFLAELGPHVTGKEKASGLFPSSSATLVKVEFVPPTTFFLLKNKDVVPGSLTFSEKDIFETEVTPALVSSITGGVTISFNITSPVGNIGEYHVDYLNGIVTGYSAPTGRSYARYEYRDFPWQVRWSPVSVYSLRDPVYREKLFETEVGVDNWERDGVVTSEGSDVYTQIFDKSPCMWGE